MNTSVRVLMGVFLAGAAAIAPAVFAQEGEAEPVKPWSNEAQVALVDTAGNSSSRNFAVANRFTYNWTYSELVLTVDMFRASSQSRVLTNTDTGVVASFIDRTDSERYELTGKYRQNFFDEMFWYGRGAWYRNRPAGTDSRSSIGAGVGYRFLENATTLVAGEAGAELDRETPVGGMVDTFVSARGFFEVRHRLSETARVNIGLEAVDNLQNTADLRLNATAAVTSQLTDVFALRVTWDLKYDNEPSRVIVDTNPDAPPGVFEFDKSDRTLSASLVISF